MGKRLNYLVANFVESVGDLLVGGSWEFEKRRVGGSTRPRRGVPVSWSRYLLYFAHLSALNPTT